MTKEDAEGVAYVINLRAPWMRRGDAAALASDMQNQFPAFVWYYNADTQRVEIYDAVTA